MSATGQRPPLRRHVLSTDVKDHLLEAIVSGRFEPGSRIVETRVAQELGVSQAPVREAIRELAVVGVLDVEPHRGARVRQPSREELIEAAEVRGVLEAHAARLACQRLDDRDRAHLQRLLDELWRVSQEGDAQEHARLNSAFHEQQVIAAANPTLLRLWRMLDPVARTYLTAMLSGVDLCVLAERHERLLTAICGGDPDAAEAAARTHQHEAAQLIAAAPDDAFRAAETHEDDVT